MRSKRRGQSATAGLSGSEIKSGVLAWQPGCRSAQKLGTPYERRAQYLPQFARLSAII
jgi:hypothetical protein